MNEKDKIYNELKIKQQELLEKMVRLIQKKNIFKLIFILFRNLVKKKFYN